MKKIVDSTFTKVTEIIEGMEVICSSINNAVPNYRLTIDGKMCVDCIESHGSIQIGSYNKNCITHWQESLPVQLRGTECYSYLFCNFLRTYLMDRLPHVTNETREQIVKLFTEFAHKEYIERKLVYKEVDCKTYTTAKHNVDDVLKKLNDKSNNYFLADNRIYLHYFSKRNRYIMLELEECVTSVMNLMVLDIHGEEEIKYSLNSIVKMFVNLYGREVGVDLESR